MYKESVTGYQFTLNGSVHDIIFNSKIHHGRICIKESPLIKVDNECVVTSKCMFIISFRKFNITNSIVICNVHMNLIMKRGVK